MSEAQTNNLSEKEPLLDKNLSDKSLANESLSNEKPANESSSNEKLSNEKLNFILAICAILISAASFYATYIQANASKQQVKAMTYPLIQFSHGNYDMKERVNRIEFSLKNSGVGPAIIKQVRFEYAGKEYSELNQFLKACCSKEFAEFNQMRKTLSVEQTDNQVLTAIIDERVMSMSEEISFLSLNKDELNLPLWNKLNAARWQLSLDVCYCSLLETCYRTKQAGVVEEVQACH